MDEYPAILDDGLLTIVDWPYIREHESWFVYIGHTVTSKSVIHTYAFKV